MKKILLSLFIAMNVLIMSLITLPIEVLAETVDVEYLDENGIEQTVSARILNSGSPGQLDTGWYVIQGNSHRPGVININGDVNLILADGQSFSVRGAQNRAGITLTGSNSLTIYGQKNGTGQLVAQGNGSAAGIGGNMGDSGGIIKIVGGNVTAKGGQYSGAGIGGGSGGSGASVTISGGKVTATGGYSAAGIGGGSQGSGGTVNINGGEVTATGSKGVGGIGGGAGIGGGYNKNGGTINITSGTVTATGGDKASGIGGGDQGNGGTINITGGTVTARGGNSAADIGGGHSGSGGNISITGGRVTATGGGYYGAGIGGGQNGDGGSISISDGEVSASGGTGAAAIGGGHSGSGGSINITSGTVTAKGGSNAASIGGGSQASGGTIVITGGRVMATGASSEGIGIGHGWVYRGSGGSITISGGDVTATGGGGGAGIGGGGSSASGAAITINDGRVIARGGRSSAGIGGSSGGSGGIIKIAGGEVIATGGQSGAGIGGGYYGQGASITISGGEVSATGGSSAAGIGGGITGDGGDVNITGGTVFAQAYSSMKDIGGGSGSSSDGSLTISGNAALFLRNDNCVEPVTETHQHKTFSNSAETGYDFPEAWYSDFGAWLRLPKITFDSAGGSEMEDITQVQGTAITAPTDPSRDGYTFDGWDPALPETMPNSDLNLTAKWKINQYTITFDSTGGSEVDDIIQNYGTSVTAPADPTRDGYTFDDWDPSLSETIPNSDLSLTAKWRINQYTINFDSRAGSKVDDIKQDYGTEIIAPADPTRDGYTFDGWDPALPETMPSNDLNLAAKWKKIAAVSKETEPDTIELDASKTDSVKKTDPVATETTKKLLATGQRDFFLLIAIALLLIDGGLLVLFVNDKVKKDKS